MTEKQNFLHIGGQAVIEGVMMRARKNIAIAVRRPNGEVVIKEGAWQSLSDRHSFLQWPLVRGGLAMVEALVNGISALTFSASQAMEQTDEEAHPEAGNMAIMSTVIFSLLFGIGLFVVLPHFLSVMLGRVLGTGWGVENAMFHVVDGIIKVSVFLAYVCSISRLEEVKRMFEYHGAEHKSVFAYEAGAALTVENVRRFSIFHPRCGTAFVLVVLVLSMLFFSAAFPFLPKLGHMSSVMRSALTVVIKMIFMFPIAGIAYEIIRFASHRMDNALVRLAVLPGLWMQKFTTREPDDAQLEVAIAALQRALNIHAPIAEEVES